MGSLRKRLGRLEAEDSGSGERPESRTQKEIRAIDAEIRRLDAEIAAEEASMSEDELREARAEDGRIARTLDGLDTGAKIEALDAEIARYTNEEE